MIKRCSNHLYTLIGLPGCYGTDSVKKQSFGEEEEEEEEKVGGMYGCP